MSGIRAAGHAPHPADIAVELNDIDTINVVLDYEFESIIKKDSPDCRDEDRELIRKKDSAQGVSIREHPEFVNSG